MRMEHFQSLHVAMNTSSAGQATTYMQPQRIFQCLEIGEPRLLYDLILSAPATLATGYLITDVNQLADCAQQLCLLCSPRQER